MHKLVPKGQKRPSTRLKASVCTQTGPKGLYLICISCITIFVCIICISMSVYISYMYHCTHTTCICPQRAKAPKHTAQSLYVCSDGPQRPLISSHPYYCIWRGKVLSNDFKNNLFTHIHVYSNHTLNHTFLFIITSKSTFLIFRILSYFF